MKSITNLTALATLAFIPSVLAAPSLLKATREGTQEVAIRVKLDKTNSETSISVWNQAGDILGEACSNLLNSGAFVDFPISTADLDENGSGNLTLGHDVFLVHENAKLSNGVITCTQMYNDVESFVNCKASIPASLKLTPLLKRKACFTISNTLDLEKTSVAFGEVRAADPVNSSSLTDAPLEVQRNASNLETRQRCDNFQTGTALVGNGDPHQNYFHQQLSETIGCGINVGCSVSYGQTRSMSKQWTASAALSGWISGGYAVTTTWTSGNNYQCNGGPGQTICIWYNFAHTAYSVQNWSKNVCYGDTWSARFVLHSPNQNNRGGGYYCMVGTCRSITDNWWDRGGRAGGP